MNRRSLTSGFISRFLLALGLVTLFACDGGGDKKDTTPSSFTFSAKTDQALATQVESNAVTISDINKAVSVSVTGGEYSIAGGAYTSAAGSISNGQSLKVRGLSSSEFGATTTVNVRVSSVSRSFSITTVAQDITPNNFDLGVVTNAQVDSEFTSGPFPVRGITGAVPVSIINGTYSIDDGAPTSEAGTIEAEQLLQVQLQSSVDFSKEVIATLTIGDFTETFSVTTVDKDTTPLAMNFTNEDGANLSTEYTSNPVTITGINSVADVSITGGTYCKGDCSGAGAVFSADAGTVEYGDTITLRATSSALNSTAVPVVFTAGGLENTWTITTLADTTPPTAAIVFPTEISLTDGATLKVRGTAEDLSGISSVTVHVLNGDTQVSQAVATSYTDEGFARWTAEVTLTADTVNTLRVSVLDGADTPVANNSADEVVVNHSSDYSTLDFPSLADQEPLYYISAAGQLVLDKAGDRLLYVYSSKIAAIDISTGKRSQILDDPGASFQSAAHQGNSLLIADQNERVISLNEATKAISVISSLTVGSGATMDAPAAVVYVEDKNLYYVLDGVEDSIYSVVENGDRTLISGLGFPDGEDTLMDGPHALQLIPESNLAYVITANAPDLLTVDLSMGEREVYIDGASESFEDLRGLVLDYANNRLFVSDYDVRKVYEINTETKAVKVIADATTGSNQFERPAALSLDKEKGILYFPAAPIFFDQGTTIYAVDVESGERVVINRYY